MLKTLTALGVFLVVASAQVRDPYHDVQPEQPLYLAPTDKFFIRGGIDPRENTVNYWHDLSADIVRRRLATVQRTGVAKNLILFLGDGMSIPTLTAARIYLGQLSNEAGENSQLSFEKFPYTGLSKTYCTDSQVADSACSSTAYLSGVKGNIHTIGVTADVKKRDWRAMMNPAFHTKSILHWAQEAGKGTGIVTTCRVTDASPSGTYAHSAYRLWQTDLNVLESDPRADLSRVKDIASQLMENEPGINFKVIMGGGSQVFLPKNTRDDNGNEGIRGDRKDLIETWKNHKRSINARATYITNKQQLLNFDVNNNDYLLGLFNGDHMAYHKLADNNKQPTLAEMTALAIKMMRKEQNGYMLFIEGGRIDHGHHENRAHLALDETVQLSDAVEVATKMTSEDDTLIVVTADHAHTMAINGYPARGSDIFSYLQGTLDNLTYSTLSYANGPNEGRFDPDRRQHNIVTDNRGNPNYTFQTINLLPTETHDGMDVAVFARGPWSHLFVGNYEQTTIPMAMAYAARIGPAVERFNLGSSRQSEGSSRQSAGSTRQSEGSSRQSAGSTRQSEGSSRQSAGPWGRPRERPRPYSD